MRGATTLFAFALCGLAVATPAMPGAAEACALPTSETHIVARVIDAETLLLDDGSEVRLIGALVPKSSGEEADRALAAVKDLVLGRAVGLRYGGRRLDRYGRHLAHVFALPGGEQIWVQARLIEGGHARAYALPGSDSCLSQLMAKEETARQARVGLWSLSANRVRLAEHTRELLTLSGQFALVEGRVRSVAKRAFRTYLNFGTDWRRDFTISVPSRLIRKNEGADAFLKSLEGRSVRVRGWIERRNGPLIEASSLAEIEVLESAQDRDF